MIHLLTTVAFGIALFYGVVKSMDFFLNKQKDPNDTDPS
jgi:hypothetical protein